MRLSASDGRRQEALAQFQDLKRSLRREFEDEPDDETRRGERRAPFVLNALAVSHESGGMDEHAGWAQKLHQDMEPSLTGGAYINFLSAEGEERVRAAYGPEKFSRPQALKDRYDPNQPLSAQPEHPTLGPGDLSRPRGQAPRPGRGDRPQLTPLVLLRAERLPAQAG
jgi:hypothetical protein